ncbi:MAG: alginate export family protein [Akkermansiaceae bacterium]
MHPHRSTRQASAHTPLSCLLLAAASTLAHAGVTETTLAPPPAAEPWIVPTIDIRARYEFADAAGLDPSHAFTLRERLGLKTAAWNGFSAFIEGEFSQAAIDDYHGGALGASPFDPANTAIFDPETNELNQLYLQYAGYESVVKIGRQRLIYDNAAFIGNVGWRQNEQTFDAISFTNQSIQDLTLNLAYIDQVNRIFGSDADNQTANRQDVSSEIYLLNTRYTGIRGLTVGGYAYFMKFDEPVVEGWDNQTYGVTAKGDLLGLTLYGELAYQTDAGPANDTEALYAHFSATKTLGTHAFTAGIEFLDAGFQTPLATVHAFNGFADAFIGQRITGTHGGLTNPYISHSLPIFWGMKWTNTLHAFGDNSLSTDRGWEIDSVLVKKFDDQFTAIAKLAHFESEDVLPTTTRFSVELNYTF